MSLAPLCSWQHCHSGPQIRDLVWYSRTQRGLWQACSLPGSLGNAVGFACDEIRDHHPAMPYFAFPGRFIAVLWDLFFRQFDLSKVGAKVLLLALTRSRTSYSCVKAPVLLFSAGPFASGTRNPPDLVASSLPGDSDHHLLLLPLAEQSAQLSQMLLPSYFSSLFSTDLECLLEPEKLIIFLILVNFVTFSYCCHCPACSGQFFHAFCIPAFTDLKCLSGHIVVLHVLLGSLWTSGSYFFLSVNRMFLLTPLKKRGIQALMFSLCCCKLLYKIMFL